jgi:hypothetical protein
MHEMQLSKVLILFLILGFSIVAFLSISLNNRDNTSLEKQQQITTQKLFEYLDKIYNSVESKLKVMERTIQSLEEKMNLTSFVNVTKLKPNIQSSGFIYPGLFDEFESPTILHEWVRFLNVNCVCGNKSPIGSFSKDGYKIICTDLVRRSECIVYSLGSFGNHEFEDSIKSRFGCEAYTIDKDKYTLPEWIHFIQAKIGNPKKCSSCVTINQLLQKNGHSDTPIDIFKIDIEGYEWQLLDQIFNSNFGQIAIEIHEIKPSHLDFLKKFQKKWCLADIAINLRCDYCLELTFVNKKWLGASQSFYS